MATFRHGRPLMCDYTPGSAVTAGDVVVVDDIPCVAHVDIAASALGALAVVGGVYEMTAAAAIVAGSKVYWDAAAEKVTETAASNKIFGYIAPGSSSAADGDAVQVIHQPMS